MSDLSLNSVGEQRERRKRSDAQRNLRGLLQAAMEVFSIAGVEAPVRQIAERAGVGLGTVYRHFPQRSDLIVAVFQNQVDACADEAVVLGNEYPPLEALNRWIDRYMEFIGTKRGLAAALHSGDSAYCALPSYFDQRFQPALQGLLDRAADAGQIRPGVRADDLLRTIASICRGPRDQEPPYARVMVGVLLKGMTV